MENLKKKIQEIFSNNATTISGLNEGEKAFLPYFLLGKTLIISPNKESFEIYKETLLSLGKKVVEFEDKLPLLITLSEKKSEIFKSYYNSLSQLASNDYDIILATPQALFQKLPNIDYIKTHTINIEKGQNFSQKEFVSKLIDIGYQKTDLVLEKGDFSVRGDIIDIFCVNFDNPIRISFFDDEVENIYQFDLSNYKKLSEINDLAIYCFSFFRLQDLDKEKVIINVKNDLSKLSISPESMLRISSIVSTQIEYLQNNSSQLSSVFFLPFCDYFTSSIFDFIQKDTTIIFDEPKLLSDKISIINDENINNFLNLSLSGEFLPQHMKFYFEKKDIFKDISKFKLIAYSRLISQNPIFKSQNVVNFICPHIPKYINHFVELSQDVYSFEKNKNTVLICSSQSLILNRIKSFLVDKELKFFEVNSLDEINYEHINLLKKDIPYSSYFEMEKFICIGSKSLSNKESLITKKVVTKQTYLPSVGDYVVHEVHGVGKCIGIKNLKLSTTYRDYIVIEYRDGDLLYLPSENADMLSKYSASEGVKLNKIGGTEFYKIKQKVKSSIKQMTFDLLKVYSSRLNAKGFVYSKDGFLQKEFEASFPYSYTADQVRALQEIKRDMESPRIMDRLLCGDVGFGKTEVALASAFKAIQDGKQVAFICPTTILCEQHYSTAITRMKDFFVTVASLNRFKTKKERELILKDLYEGKINLICGTHSLLSKDVKFRDLGLVIIDEEQRFGVEDKEKLKNIKNSVDVLSMSATPIPRTLHMALSGIRDISFLLSPPKERKEIKTNVIDYSDNILVSACQKEISRGGQVLIVYNRVDSIANFYSHVKALLPFAVVDFVHGQMSSKMLEQKIYDLYTRKTQILVSTVLIEQGIDLPQANTLFVIDADKLGLSQLYQLRGRIGRSNIEAYAYFSFSKNKVLTQDSYKRLDAIMEFNEFGSGYKIALRDLEIRGAGDVLGRVQHGHMQQVGYDLYVKLLNETISEMRGEKVEDLREIKIDISINAFLPNDYISSNENRIAFYTRVAKIQTEGELENILKETKDTYGSLPESVIELCKIGLIKNLGQKLKVSRILLNDFSRKVSFYEDVISTKLYDFLSKNNADFVLNKDKLPIITLKEETSIQKQQDKLIKFLLNCLEFVNN